MSNQFNTCRICKLAGYEHSEALMKYSVRHYAHMSCGLNRFGIKFLTMIPAHEISSMPWKLVDQYRIREILNDDGTLRPLSEWQGSICVNCFTSSVGNQHISGGVEHVVITRELHA